jgi:hypothetical protein
MQALRNLEPAEPQPGASQQTIENDCDPRDGQRIEQHDQVPSDADAPCEERAKQLFELGPSLVSGCEQDRRQARTEGPQEDEEEQQQGW